MVRKSAKRVERIEKLKKISIVLLITTAMVVILWDLIPKDFTIDTTSDNKLITAFSTDVNTINQIEIMEHNNISYYSIISDEDKVTLINTKDVGLIELTDDVQSSWVYLKPHYKLTLNQEHFYKVMKKER